jgi:glycosyltransferase involved in cell wall biosynthesis
MPAHIGPLRVLLLDLGREFRGGQRQVLALARHLSQDENFEPTLAAPRNAPLTRRAEELGLHVVHLPGRREFDMRVVYSLFSMLRRRKIQILHSNDAHGASLGAMLKQVAKGVTLVHSRRVSYPLKIGWSTKKYEAADHVVAVSREIADVLAKSGLKQEKISVIHSGIEPGDYPDAREAAEGPLVIGTVGALTPQKGTDVFLKALARMQAESCPERGFRGVVVGKGPLMEPLEKQAEALGIADLVEFTGYRSSKKEVPKMHVLCVPSVDGEGSNAVIKEGWACGVPVVVSDLPSNLELVHHGMEGLVAAAGDAAALAKALCKAASNESLRTDLIVQGRKRLADFTMERTAEAHKALYRRLVSKKG